MSLIQRLLSRNSYQTETKNKSQKIISELTPDQFATLLSQIDSVRIQDEPSKAKEYSQQTRQQMLRNYYSSELNYKRRAGSIGEHNDIMMKLIIKYYDGELTAKASEYVIKFSDDSEIWIGNKYYAYGSLYRHKHIYDSSERVSDEVFVEILHLENTLKSPFYAIEKLPRLV